MNITLELYNLIWNTFFSGELPELLSACAEEICTIMTIAGIALVIALPLMVMFGLIKWIWNFVR